MNRRELLLSSLELAVLPVVLAQPTQKWALLIGVDQYEDTNIGALSGAANDALALQQLLIDKLKFLPENIRILTSNSSNKPTRAAILSELAWLVRNAKQGDTVVVAYSGHGIEIEGKPYLLPYDTRADDDSTIVDTALETTKFQERLRAVRASVRLYLFDMCRTDPRRAKDAVAPDNKLAAGLVRGLDFSGAKPATDGSAAPVIVTLMACSEGERSWEWKDKKRGYFSWFVEQGLKGEAADETGTVTLASLKKFVGDEVPKAVKAALNQNQNPLPQVIGNDQVVLLSGVVGKTTIVLKSTTARLSFVGLPEGAQAKVAGQVLSGEYREDLVDKTRLVSVVITAPGYKSYSGSVELKRGELVTSSPKLEPLPLARLVFPELPAGAVLKVDGKVVLGREYSEELSSATKMVEVSVSGLSGYQAYVAEMELRRGLVVKAEILLVKKANPDPIPPPDATAGKGVFVSAASKARSAGCPQLAAYLEAMQPIPGGTFQMGSNDGDPDEKPVHSVTLSDYWLGRTLVPQELWAEYAKKGGGKMPEAPDWGWLANHPIVLVSWNDIQGFCTWASRVSGVALVLPTEAQWEFAARGGGKDVEYPWGNTFDGSKCVHSVSPGNSQGHTAPVDRSDRVYKVKFDNGSELLDMSGNVWQWCSDWKGDYSSGAQTNPTGASSGPHKVARGGSWIYFNADYFRCAYRNNFIPSFAYNSWGFRLSSRT